MAETNLSYYKLLFIAELLVAEFIFFNRLKKRKGFCWKYPLAILFNVAFVFFFPILSYNAVYCSVMFLIIFAVSVASMAFCFDEKFENLLFCGIAGYSTQHVTYELYNLTLVIFDYNYNGGNIYSEGNDFFSIFFPNPFIIMLYLGLYFSAYSCAYFLFGSRMKKDEELKLNNISLLAIVTIVIVVDVVMNAVIVYNFSSLENKPLEKMLRIILGVYNILCCFLATYMQFEISFRKRLEDELEIVKRLRHKEQQQYKISKENIELIDMKCHDLKHQLAALSAGAALPKDYVEEINQTLSIYDSSIDSGNGALNVVLMEKSLKCASEHIRLTCVADGSRLDFMAEGYIYSLFGNLMDNALEACMQVDESKRTINIRVGAEGDVLKISVYNYFKGNLVFDGSLPNTTKENKHYHGFGLKSIRYAVEKYGGKMEICPSGNIFEIKIEIPLPKSGGKIV